LADEIGQLYRSSDISFTVISLLSVLGRYWREWQLLLKDPIQPVSSDLLEIHALANLGSQAVDMMCLCSNYIFWSLQYCDIFL